MGSLTKIESAICSLSCLKLWKDLAISYFSKAVTKSSTQLHQVGDSYLRMLIVLKIFEE